MNARQVGQLSKLKVPGKVMAAVIESLVVLLSSGRKSEDKVPSLENACSRKRALGVEAKLIAKRRHLSESETVCVESRPTGEAIGDNPGKAHSMQGVEVLQSSGVEALSTVVDKAV